MWNARGPSTTTVNRFMCPLLAHDNSGCSLSICACRSNVTVRRAYAARGERPASKTALTKDPLEGMLATCTDGLIGIRDRALLTFAFSSGGRRRSEVTAAVMENLVKVD